MFIAPSSPRRAAARISLPLIDIDERDLVQPRVTFFGTLWHLPPREVLAGIAFAFLVAALLIALAVFS